jgi:hypothetical protein
MVNINDTHMLIEPSNFMDDDVGAVTGRRLGVIVGEGSSIGLVTGRRVGLTFPVVVGADAGFPVGASIDIVGDFVGLIVVGAIG